MDQEFYWSILISSAVGIAADLTFLLFYFKFPLVRHSIGLNLIKFSIIFDIFYLFSKIYAVIGQETNYYILFTNSIVMDYFFLSHFNWLFFYILYLFQIICKKVQKESISLKNYFIYDILSSGIFTIGCLICEIYSNINYVKIIYLSSLLSVYFIQFIYIFISIRLSCKMYFELKSKYHQYKRKANRDFLQLISYPVVALIIITSSLIYHLCFILEINLPEIYFINDLTGILLLICLPMTQEFKDSMKLIRHERVKLISYEIK